MKNIIIVTQGTYTLRYSIDTATHVVKKTWMDSAVDVSDTRANSLAAIVKTLEQIDAMENKGEPVVVYGINLVVDMIKSGTPLFWLNNGGKTSQGDEINKTELELWDKFYTLYQPNIRNVIFKTQAISKYGNNSKNEDYRDVAKYVSAAWEEVKEKAKHLEEVETDCI